MKTRHYKGLELLAFNPTKSMPAHRRAVEGFRYRLLATYLTLKAIAALPRVVSSRQIWRYSIPIGRSIGRAV